MHKITKRLLCYFTALLLVFAVIAYAGFSMALLYQTYRSHEQELQNRAQTIADKVEQFIGTSGPKQGRGAYLRFVDDIAMAKAYIIDADGNPFSFGHNGAVSGTPSKKTVEFAQGVFESGQYTHCRKKDLQGAEVFYAGAPVYYAGQVAAAVIILDTMELEYQSFFHAITILGACLIFAFLLSELFSILLSRRFMKPIHQIASMAKALAGGNYQVVSDVEDKTELGELAKEMDLLARKLETARLESSRLEQMQKDYISNISHELRTPVAVLRGSLEAICDGVVKGEKAMEYQRQMLAESISLQRLVNDMLELSRLQNKDFPIEKEPVDLLMPLEDAVRAVRVIAQQKSIDILYEKKAGEWLIPGDYGRLRQMFIAALDNAIKYSLNGAQVLVKAEESGDAVTVSIQDHGCGIPQEDLQNIFSRFYRSRHNKEKGSGLGLAIMKSIGERHNMEVYLESTWQVGTKVIFRLPAGCLSQSSLNCP